MAVLKTLPRPLRKTKPRLDPRAAELAMWWFQKARKLREELRAARADEAKP